MPISENAARNDEESSNELQLSEGVSQFVESMGMMMERYGLPRIGGRIMGLFMVDDEPLSLDDVARLLGVSRASVSTNLRMTEMSGLAKRVSRPGDRRDYYVGMDDMWMQAIKTSKTDAVVQMADAARAALPKVPAEDVVARERLQEVIDFAEFFTEGLERMLTEWEEHRAKLSATRHGEKTPDQL